MYFYIFVKSLINIFKCFFSYYYSYIRSIREKFRLTKISLYLSLLKLDKVVLYSRLIL